MTGWEPATEAEIAMRDALRAGDQEQYFRVLARTRLLLPVSADALAGRAPMGWGTWTTGGRTHVLAFTSAEALQACLAEHAGSARDLPYPELAAGWPNLEWWLAVNPGLPIEGYLPAWFVAQLARGDVRMPGRQSTDDPPARANAPVRPQDDTPNGIPAPATVGGGYGAGPGPVAPAQAAAPPAQAAAPPTPLLTKSGLPRRQSPASAPGFGAPAAVPPGAPSPHPAPYAPPVSPGPQGASGPSYAPPVSPGPGGAVSPVHDAAVSPGPYGAPGSPAPYGGAPAAPGSPPPYGAPGSPPPYGAPGSPAPYGAPGPPPPYGAPSPAPNGMPGGAGAAPASPLAAAPPPALPESLPRRPGVFPRRPDPGAGFGRPQQGEPARDEPQPGQPAPHGHHPDPRFEQAGSGSFGAPPAPAPVPPSMPDALPQRPNPGWPGNTAQAAAPPAATMGAPSMSPRPPTDRPAAPDPSFVAANEVEQALLAAAGDGSTDSFLSTLLLAKVLVPVPAGASRSALPGDNDFTWRTETIDGERFVVVFTSVERLGEHMPEPVVTISAKFIQLIRAWPDSTLSFAVNPGTPVGATLPGAQILALATWAADVGLGAEDEDEPAEAVAGEPAQRVHRPAPEDPNRPTVMQKIVQPDQVDYYLERGYDRVSGFVHRAAEVARLRTPAKLVTALGLRYTGSPFAVDASQIHVLRWPAYRPSLYRIPYGGQSEAAMRAMEGWVIERPPFRGNGFAPGDSSEVIAEFKVDSARLPNGAQLWCVTADGAEKLVAVLDADRPVWRRVGED